MKKINFLVAIVIIAMFNLISCEKENDVQNSTNRQSERILTDSQIIEIGLKHNQNLEIAFNNFNWNSSNKFNELKNNFNSVEYFDSSKKINTIDENQKIIMSNLEDKNNFQYFKSVFEYLESDKTTKTVSAIEGHLNLLENEFKSKNNSNLDYETFLVFSSVLKNSAKFWLPKSLGGLGKFDEFKERENVNLYSKVDWRDCLKDVLAADGTSAGAGFIVGAGVAAAATGPIAPLAFIGAIAAEAGISSGWEYLSSDNC